MKEEDAGIFVSENMLTVRGKKKSSKEVKRED